MQAPQSWNIYSYTEGDPVNYLDPTRLAVDCADSAVSYNGVYQGTVGSLLSGGTNLDLLSTTIFAESNKSTSSSGLQQMGWIGAVIMNRLNILDCYYWVFGSLGGIINLSPYFGLPNATLSQVLFAPSQFAVWASPCVLTPTEQTGLESALDSPERSSDCNALVAAIGTGLEYLQSQGTRQLYAVNNLILSSFNSGGYVPPSPQKLVGSSGSINVFYGIPVAQVVAVTNGPVPIYPRPPHHRPVTSRIGRIPAAGGI